MTDFPPAIEEYPYAARVRSLAGRAHRLLRSRPSAGDLAPGEVDAFLRQADDLRTRLSLHHRGELLRWVDGLRERVEALEFRPLEAGVASTAFDSGLATRPGRH